VVLLLAGCRGDTGSSTATGTGTLHVAVSGVPAGSTASIAVTGPGNFSRVVTATAALADLIPASYHVVATPVTTSHAELYPSPAEQDVTVSADTTVSVSITYSSAIGGSLIVTVSGLPSDTAPAITINGPAGYERTSYGNTELDSLAAGAYTVSAAAVTTGGVTYQPLPATQTVSIDGVQVSVAIRYQVATTGLTINVDGVYIDQGAQTYNFGVPLVRDRPGLLRVFLRANQANTAAPDVRVRFYQAGALVQTDTIAAHRAGVTQAIAEGDTTASWNLALPEMFIEPGLQILVDVDPSAVIPLATRAGLTYPASGAPGTLDVRTAGSYDLTFLPVLNTADAQTGNVSSATAASYLRAVRLLHPMWQYTASVHAVFTFTGGLFESSDQNGAMANLLQQVEMLRLAEGASHYYYGVMHLPYTSGQVGLGYINTGAPGSRSAIGWDQLGTNPLTDASETYAHELGHNMGLFHAPCGGATSPDPNYPYAGGQVGVYGYNVVTGAITGLQNFDMMSYCTPTWISDYSYGRLITLAPTLGSLAAADRAAPTHGYLVSGTMRDGSVQLNPAIELTTDPALPTAAGPWRLQGVAANGQVLFALSFAPTEVADGVSGPVQQFAFVVPLDSTAALDHIDVTGPSTGAERRARVAAGLSADTAMATVTRVTPSTIRISWSPVEYPLLMVRDASTRAVLALLSGGTAVVQTDAAELEIIASDGVRSRMERVRP
jgi:hypothetical protein